MTEAITFLSQSETLPFTTSLVLMVLIGLISALGLDFDLDADVPSVDIDADAGGLDTAGGITMLDWVNPGRMPILAAFTLFLLIYSLVGLIGQQILRDSTGMLPGWMAALAAFVPAYLVWQPASRVLGRIMPRDHTDAVSVRTLQGRRGKIEVGVATHDNPARAIVRDVYGTRHVVMVRMSLPGQEARTDEEVYLLEIGRDGEPSIAAPVEQPSILSI